MKIHRSKGIALMAAGVVLVAVAIGGAAAAQVASGSGFAGNGDNIIRLINPNGSANVGLPGGSAPTCAMIYVLDDDQELGECCGCPITSAGLTTFSVLRNLNNNWVSGGEGIGDNASGAIAIIAAVPNVAFTPTSPNNGHLCPVGQTGACNAGCDPTNRPGFPVTSARNLLGSIVHNQVVSVGTSINQTIAGLTEVAMSDDAGGDPTNLTYLQNACGALVGNSTGAGICNCPQE